MANPRDMMGKALAPLGVAAGTAAAAGLLRRSSRFGCEGWAGAMAGLLAAACDARAEDAAWPWPDQGDWAWWALLGALLALGAIVVALRAVGYKRLTPLGQCIIVSILAHVALTAGMSLVVLSRPVISLLVRHDADAGSVNLVVGGEAELRSQIRYQLSELPVADPSLAALMQADLVAVRSPQFRPMELAAPLSGPQKTELLGPPEDRPAAQPPAAGERVALSPPPEGLVQVALAPDRPLSASEPPAPDPGESRVPAASASAEARPTEASPAPWREAVVAVPAAAPLAESHLAAAPPPTPLPPPPPEAASAALAAGIRPERARVDPPQVSLSLSLSLSLSTPPRAARQEEQPPPTAPMVVVDPQDRRPPGAVDLPPGPAGLGAASMDRTPPPTDPLGAALTSHVAAEFTHLPRPDSPAEPIRLTAAIAPLGMVTPQPIRVVEPITHRAPEKRKELVARMGGSIDSEASVSRALAYLVANQEPDGRWTFINEDGDRPGKRPANRDDMGLTGLAVLCFLAADHRPDQLGPHRKTVESGLAFLLARQADDGDLRGDGGDMYSHGIAALALGESAAMTGDAACAQAAIRAAQFIVQAQNRLTGGWRYGPGEAGDTSVLGWQVMALRSVRQLGVAIPQATRDGALKWLASVSRGRHGMLTGYQKPNPTPTMTAEAFFARLLLGQQISDEQRAEVAAYLAPPDASSPEAPNLYGWYYGSLALMQCQDESWRRWNQIVRDRLIQMQQQGGKLDGSWDPSQDVWGAQRGGRIYTTAIATLTLEVYYRYLPMLGGKTEPKPGEPN